MNHQHQYTRVHIIIQRVVVPYLHAIFNTLKLEKSKRIEESVNRSISVAITCMHDDLTSYHEGLFVRDNVNLYGE